MRVNNNVAHVAEACDGRQLPRTHLFVAATLYAGSASAPVHIRNMSPSGALVEADALPPVGTSISLSRGRLHATGNIAWRAGRRAGVRFEAAVTVPDWMARQVSAGQQRVDALLAIVKKDARPEVSADSASPANVVDELGWLRSELGQLETALLRDATVVAAHPEIQAIDISIQRIDRILELLRAA